MPFDASPLNQTTRDLIAARTYLETHGWCQHEAHNSQTNQVCAVGALNKIIAPDWNGEQLLYAYPETIQRRAPSYKLLLKVIGGKSTDHLALANWNDAPERTLSDVLAAYDRAIALSMETA